MAVVHMTESEVGLVLDSSVLIAAERRKLTPDQAIESVLETAGEIPIILSSVTVAEVVQL
jgi:predicted nucleic acid-binding protein